MADGFSFMTVTAADTITITTADAINAVAIIVPSTATDSVVLYGLSRTLNSGTVSQVQAGLKIAPGDPSLTFGNGLNPIKYIYIIVRDQAQIITQSPVRR